ncbi:hypothetical protein [Sphingomonas sp. R86521]|uniref:hypothetical protein n=1 Tax=Sphingomonas sp. R86521 TaxID=3093860 RepID=UPI0036D42C7D
MDIPWNEEATLVRMSRVDAAGDPSGEILFEGSLLTIALRVRAMKPAERRGLRLSLPNRKVRPHTFQDGSLAALIEDIPSTDEWRSMR